MDRDGKGDGRDPDLPPTPEELAAAESLRRALDDPRLASSAADFARAVSLAHEPRKIAEDEHRAIVAKALERAEGRRRGAPARATRRTLGTWAAAGGLALAAAVALAIGTTSFDRDLRPAASIEPLVPARSTQPLFREPFARAGGESARIDRIASARSADLRDNRFAAWGVR